jgi:hypothetical protein
MNKVFFVTKKDFKSLQKNGIAIPLTDENTDEKLLFVARI